MVKIIVAYCVDSRIIGKDNCLPWGRLKGDLPRFQSLTSHNAVVMGRKTWESLPKKPLPNRFNVIMSRDQVYKDLESPIIACFADLESAVRNYEHACDHTYIIGGEQIYRRSLELGLVGEIVASEVREDYEGDAHFPDLDDQWECISREPKEGYDLVIYRNRNRR